MKILPTERLCLRPLREDDAAALYHWCRDPLLGTNAGWKPHESLAESREVLRTVFLGWSDIYAVTLRGDDALIGTVGLMDDPKRQNPAAKMLGYWLGRDHWGKGYIPEAVRALVKDVFADGRAALISAYCYADNARSRRVLEKCGFVYEGRLRAGERCWDGQTRDELLFSLTPADCK